VLRGWRTLITAVRGLLHPLVLEKITCNFQAIERLGAYSHAANAWIEQEKDKTRSVLGELLQVPPTHITLTQNTTEGL
jgi:selenocysteine lyase/cysteine desulfurase